MDAIWKMMFSRNWGWIARHEGDPIQRRIDELSMKMLGLGDRIREIDAIREAVAAELKVLDEMLAASSKAEKRRGVERGILTSDR